MKKNKKWRRGAEAQFAPPKFEELVYHYDIYSDFKLTVVISNDPVAAVWYIGDRDYLKDPAGTIAGGDAFTVSCPENGRASIFIRPDVEASTIAHESYHAVRAITAFIGASEEEEFVAYLLGDIVGMVTAFQKKVSKRFKNKK